MRIACISNSRSAKRWKMQASTGVVRATMLRATPSAKSSHPYSADDTSKYVRRSQDGIHGRILSTLAADRGHGAEPDFHHRLAAGRLDAHRADSVESFAGRRHHGAAGHPTHGALRSVGARWPDNTLGFSRTRLRRYAGGAARARASATLPKRAVYRKTDGPFFIDKMPNNWLYTGLIHLMLPNAKIIDARRHPLGCCFSGFKQHFARGQSFTYGLEDIGRYYRDYVELMAHFDAVLPGRVHGFL